ncbi:MAG: bifunctional metallophosphatase/5'-nucleotidase [Bacteroidales bacterium]|jgi:5'-nucleotidase|nr:bifunctional metallophosphatase/5'-nucleotidase [Bacteroidales bacterium]
MKRSLIAFAAALLAVGSCQQPKLVILHTNDTHSHFEPLRGGADDGVGGVIERAAFVDSVRTVYGEDRVLLLHAGDFSQGSPYFTELKGTLEPLVINDFAYDCVTLGNHEFDNDIEALTERLKMLDGTAVVCANLDLSPFELGEYVKPYAILERAGLKIGIIGLEADISTAVTRTVSSRMQQLDNVEVTNRWADYLHETEKCDLVILLSHAGYDVDQEIVPETRWVDLVIGGHTHTFVDDFLYVKNARGKEVPIITDGKWGLEMGQINVRRKLSFAR